MKIFFMAQQDLWGRPLVNLKETLSKNASWPESIENANLCVCMRLILSSPMQQKYPYTSYRAS